MRHSKKILSMALACLMAVASASCGSAGETEASSAGKESAAQSEATAVSETARDQGEEDAADSPQEEETVDRQEAAEDGAQENSADTASDTLVVYFSRTGEQYGVGVIDKGNTEIVADMIIEETGADRFEIVPVNDDYPYTYEELTDVAKKEQNENARPAYVGEVPELSQYGTVYVGAPVWWSDWPMIMYSFFEENADALAGKTLIPFSTHGGSGLAGFDRTLADVCPDSTVGEGLAIAGTDAQNNQDSVRSAVHDWIAGR